MGGLGCPNSDKDALVVIRGQTHKSPKFALKTLEEFR